MYMAPEMAEGRQVDARSDVYVLGAALFELLTGRLPHSGKGALEILTAVVTDEAPRPRDVDPSVPVALDAICAGAIAPSRRTVIRRRGSWAKTWSDG